MITSSLSFLFSFDINALHYYMSRIITATPTKELYDVPTAVY